MIYSVALPHSGMWRRTYEVSPHAGAVWSLGKALIGNALRASA